MINLIPNEERKKIIRDFYFRLLVVFFFCLGFSVFMACMAILPSFFMSSIKLNSAYAKLDVQSKEPVPEVSQQTQGVIKDVNGKLDVLERFQKNKFVVSERVVNQIISRKMSDIKILELIFEDNAGKGKKVTINGIAPSRERLLLFRRALESDTAFVKVDLPISNFIKGSNLEFSLSLVPA